MSFWQCLEFIACAAFATLCLAPERAHAFVLVAELALFAGMFGGRAYGRRSR